VCVCVSTKDAGETTDKVVMDVQLDEVFLSTRLVCLFDVIILHSGKLHAQRFSGQQPFVFE
jgi:hypothetical protein